MQLSEIVKKSVQHAEQSVGVVEGICWQKGQPCQIAFEGKTFGAGKVKGKKHLIVDLWQEQPSLPKLDVGKLVYNTCGKLLGKIAEVEIGKTLKVKYLTLDDGKQIALSQVVANNDVVMVKVPKQSQRKSAGRLNKRMQTTSNNTTTTTSGLVGADNTTGGASIAELKSPTTVGGQTQNAPPLYARRKSGDFSFLVGKIVDKNIFNFWGELMIRKGDIVTRETYLKARYFGKLTELCLHTK